MVTEEFVRGIGRGAGNIAAHEIAHQFLKELYGMDNNSSGTYNGGSCKDPAQFTGKGTDGKPIDWQSQTRDALRKALDKGVPQ